MDQIAALKQQQSDFWNGPMGKTWVDTREITDAMLAPAGDVLVAEATSRSAKAVLDIGCGNGTTTLAIAKALGPGTTATGIDLSDDMIAHAQSLSETAGSHARFLAGDAAAFHYPEGPYDLIVSRFGSMFFPDQVAALSHLRSVTADHGRLCFVVWQSPEANPFLTAAAKAASPFLPDAPAPDPDAPGPFAMADEARIVPRLREAGWTDVTYQAASFTFGFPAAHLETFMRKLAPIGRGLDQLAAPDQEALFDAVRPRLQSYVIAGRLEYLAACWIIRARAGRTYGACGQDAVIPPAIPLPC